MAVTGFRVRVSGSPPQGRLTSWELAPFAKRMVPKGMTVGMSIYRHKPLDADGKRTVCKTDKAGSIPVGGSIS